MKVILKSVDAVVVKNSSWDVSEDFKDNAQYKDLVGQKAQSVQISDWKDLYKIGGKDGTYNNLPFAKAGKITISFESYDNDK